MSAARRNRAGEQPFVKWPLIGLAAALAAFVLFAPLFIVFERALSEGVSAYLRHLGDKATLHAAGLTITTALIVVPINVAFGIGAAWLVTKHSFPAKQLLIALIELPVSISPIVAGVAYLFLYGMQGLLGPFLIEHGIKLMFAPTAIVLVSFFVTFPFAARELISTMQANGAELEEAALTLGASAWAVFRHATLPGVRWALLYGAILCNARVMGEFGAVSVVSGKIRGETNTLPLQVELLFNDYNTTGAFAAASILTGLAIVTLVIMSVADFARGRSDSDGRA